MIIKSQIFAKWLRKVADKFDPPKQVEYLGDLFSDGRLFISIDGGKPIQYAPRYQL